MPASTNWMPARREQRVAALGVLEVAVAAVDDRVARRSRSAANSSMVDSVASPAGTISHTMRGRGERGHDLLGREGALEALGHDLLGLLGRAVEGDDAVAGEMQPARHVAAHAAESDDGEVHAVGSCRDVVGSVAEAVRRAPARAAPRARPARRRGRRRGGRAGTGRPCAASDARSPSAWASMSTPKVSLRPGMGRSSGWPATSCRKQPDGRAALVQLAGRVQEARAVAERRGAAACGRAAAPGCARSASVALRGRARCRRWMAW